jgi:hypothetical protein
MHQHCDQDELALMALGEDLGGDCAMHAAQCEQCAYELAQFRDVVSLGRASGGPDSLVAPPAHVWDRISAQMATEPIPLAERAARRKRGFPTWLGMVAATVAGVLIGVGLVTVVTGGGTPEQIVASAQLAPMPDGPNRGGDAEATLNKTDEGYTVTVKATGMTGPEGFYEVWLLDEQNLGLIALGTLAPGETEATFPVPDGVDLQQFNAVDVSDEPLDGDPGHSGATVMRGTLA